MTMGLQDLMMFRDNLQQPTPTGMDNLRNLQALTMQGMAAENYMNEPMMMDTGLMSLPVAQAGFGGFIKSITRIPRTIAKGVSKAVKGVAKGVRNVAKSPIGRIGIPLLLSYYAGPLARALGPSLGIGTGLGAKALIVGGGTGLGSLVAGDDPEDALRSGVKAGGLYYAGGKLFGPSGGAGADKGIPAGQTTAAGTGGASSAYTGGATDLTNLSYGDAFQPVSMVGDTAAQTAAGITPMAPVSPDALSYQPTTTTPQLTSSGADQVILKGAQPTTIGQRITDFGSTALDKTKEALAKGVQLAKDNKLATAALGLTALSAAGPQPVQQFTPQQLSSANLRSGFDEQGAFYEDIETGERIPYRLALARIQQASQDFGTGGERKASGVRLAFENIAQPRAGSKPLGSVEELGKFAVDTLQQPLLGSQSGGMVDPMLSSSGGIMSMMYGGQTMPQNNMDVKYKEFSGMVGGRGSGMEDNVYMPIVEGEQGQQVATLAVSPKEYVVDANTMSLLGNGNPDEGAEIMDKTVKDIRKKATGQTKQQKEIDGLAALNRMRRSVS